MALWQWHKSINRRDSGSVSRNWVICTLNLCSFRVCVCVTVHVTSLKCFNYVWTCSDLCLGNDVVTKIRQRPNFSLCDDLFPSSTYDNPRSQQHEKRKTNLKAALEDNKLRCIYVRTDGSFFAWWVYVLCIYVFGLWHVLMRTTDHGFESIPGYFDESRRAFKARLMLPIKKYVLQEWKSRLW